MARSFPERCNLERPYNALWALVHNSKSVSDRIANEICFDWRASISYSQTIPLTCAFSLRFHRRFFESMSTPKVNAVRVWRRRVRSRHHGIGTWVETKLGLIAKHETTVYLLGTNGSRDRRYHCRFQIITSSKSSNYSLRDVRVN